MVQVLGFGFGAQDFGVRLVCRGFRVNFSRRGGIFGFGLGLREYMLRGSEFRA